MSDKENNNDINLYEESPFTIALDWSSGKVWINDHVNKKKFVLTERDSSRIAHNFELYRRIRLNQ